jgi:hypothetical protein
MNLIFFKLKIDIFMSKIFMIQPNEKKKFSTPYDMIIIYSLILKIKNFIFKKKIFF